MPALRLLSFNPHQQRPPAAVFVDDAIPLERRQRDGSGKAGGPSRVHQVVLEFDRAAIRLAMSAQGEPAAARFHQVHRVHGSERQPCDLARRDSPTLQDGFDAQDALCARYRSRRTPISAPWWICSSIKTTNTRRAGHLTPKWVGTSW